MKGLPDQKMKEHRYCLISRDLSPTHEQPLEATMHPICTGGYALLVQVRRPMQGPCGHALPSSLEDKTAFVFAGEFQHWGKLVIRPWARHGFRISYFQEAPDNHSPGDMDLTAIVCRTRSGGINQTCPFVQGVSP